MINGAKTIFTIRHIVFCEQAMQSRLDPIVNFRVYTGAMKPQSTLKIGDLAKETGISVEAIRFYENKGLLAASERSASGYRLYSAEDLNKLRFIQRAKKVGFRLEEIRELLELRLHPDDHTCDEVKHYTRQKIGELENKIMELEHIKVSLQRLHTACCGGDESAKNCSILQLLDSTDKL